MLKSKQEFIPGGWAFYQAEMDWTLPSPLSTGFEDAVTKIINIRLDNPRFKLPTDRPTVAAELENFTEMRLRQTYGNKANQWLVGAPATASPNFPWQPLRKAAGAVAVVNAAERAVAGIGLLTEWLGAGLKPVDQNTADSRAAICAVCPKNVAPTIVQRAYGKVADGLHLLMNAKSDLKLATSLDDKLQTCSACDCRLTLKVWTPAEHIKANTSQAVMADLHGSCWILPLLK